MAVWQGAWGLLVPDQRVGLEAGEAGDVEEDEKTWTWVERVVDSEKIELASEMRAGAAWCWVRGGGEYGRWCHTGQS